jgi:hypothetical protein
VPPEDIGLGGESEGFWRRRGRLKLRKSFLEDVQAHQNISNFVFPTASLPVYRKDSIILILRRVEIVQVLLMVLNHHHLYHEKKFGWQQTSKN